MSLTKSQPEFQRYMEEVRKMDDMSYEYYAEELYLNRRKGRLPETETKATTTKQPGDIAHKTPSHVK